MSTIRVHPGILAAGALVVLPLLGLLGASFGRDPRAVPSMMEHAPAPTFALADLDGKTWNLADLRGKKVVLNFWSTWCQPCKLEHPLLLRAQKLWPDVQFLGVIYADDAAKIGAYLDREGKAYPHLVDPGGRVAIDYGVAGVPETFFIGEDGQVLHKQSGLVNAPLLESLLGPPR